MKIIYEKEIDGFKFTLRKDNKNLNALTVENFIERSKSKKRVAEALELVKQLKLKEKINMVRYVNFETKKAPYSHIERKRSEDNIVIRSTHGHMSRRKR